MENLRAIREALAARRGQLTALAASSGVSRKTIHRLSDPKYLPNVRTVLLLEAALASDDHAGPAEKKNER